MHHQLYRVVICSVDGETVFECVGIKETIIQFLDRYDHEGSSIFLCKIVEIKIEDLIND